MKMRFTTPCVIALLVSLPLVTLDASAQTGTPGTRQMRDVQRKAEQKARHTHSSNQTQAAQQHHKASAAAPASAP